MKTWKDELRARIAEITEQGFEAYRAANPPKQGANTNLASAAEVVVIGQAEPIPSYAGFGSLSSDQLSKDMAAFDHITKTMGALNDAEFCGAERGTLMLWTYNTDQMQLRSSADRNEAVVEFLYRPIDLNKAQREDGVWDDIRFIATGEPPYKYADFNVLT